MSICPKGKLSKGRRDKRRAQSFVIPTQTLSACPKCGAYVRAHRACRACGTYNRREVLAVK